MAHAKRSVAHSEDWMQSLLVGHEIADERDLNEQTLPRRRLNFMLIGLVVIFTLLLLRLFSMQVLSGQRYAQLASGNRIREIVSYAPRGRIYDKHGVVLADNTLDFELTAIPYLTAGNEDLDRDLKTVANITGLTVAQLRQRLLEHGADFTQPVVLAEHLTHRQALRLEAAAPGLNGFTIDEIPVRFYAKNTGLANVIGYTGRVSEADLDADHHQRLLPTDFIGKDGIESSYDQTLRGTNGWQRIEVDAMGRPVRVLGKQEPKPGQDLHLTIDIHVQKVMTQALLEEMKKARVTRSAAVAVSPQDGSIIAMTTMPTYDNNLFARGITTAEFKRLVDNPNQPLVNKAIAGGYATGSIIKPLVASAALQEGVVNDKTVIVDRGYIDVTSQYQPGAYFRFRGWNPNGLGPMNIRSALAWSSNIYFFTVGGGHGNIQGLGVDRLTRYYQQFGLGSTTGIDLPGEISGLVPDPDWKKETKNEDWYLGDTYNISVGQGDMQVSPLQITMAQAAVANYGAVLKPFVVAGNQRTIRLQLPIDRQYFQIVHEGMRQVLTGGLTCECIFKDVPVKVAGKSGTAETNPDAHRRPHGWFTAFAPYTNPEITATVFLDEGFNGTEFGAPVVAKTMTAYFQH